jgi:hypothetical protein
VARLRVASQVMACQQAPPSLGGAASASRMAAMASADQPYLWRWPWTLAGVAASARLKEALKHQVSTLHLRRLLQSC